MGKSLGDWWFGAGIWDINWGLWGKGVGFVLLSTKNKSGDWENWR